MIVLLGLGFEMLKLELSGLGPWQGLQWWFVSLIHMLVVM